MNNDRNNIVDLVARSLIEGKSITWVTSSQQQASQVKRDILLQIMWLLPVMKHIVENKAYQVIFGNGGRLELVTASLMNITGQHSDICVIESTSIDNQAIKEARRIAKSLTIEVR